MQVPFGFEEGEQEVVEAHGASKDARPDSNQEIAPVRLQRR